MPLPPPHPRGGTPGGLSHYKLPYFLGFLCGVWLPFLGGSSCGASAPAFAALSWAGALALLGCPRGIRVALATCLLLSVRCSHCIGSVFFRRWPYADRLPDLDDVHSLYLLFQLHPRLTPKHHPYDCGVI